MNTKQATELGRFATNVEETLNNDSNSKQLYETVEIKDTPFTAVKLENKWFLTMGKYRISETMLTLEECQENAQTTDWYRLMTIMHIMILERENEIKNDNTRA